jgi:hypothetical protein
MNTFPIERGEPSGLSDDTGSVSKRGRWRRYAIGAAVAAGAMTFGAGQAFAGSEPLPMPEPLPVDSLDSFDVAASGQQTDPTSEVGSMILSSADPLAPTNGVAEATDTDTVTQDGSNTNVVSDSSVNVAGDDTQTAVGETGSGEGAGLLDTTDTTATTAGQDGTAEGGPAEESSDSDQASVTGQNTSVEVSSNGSVGDGSGSAEQVDAEQANAGQTVVPVSAEQALNDALGLPGISSQSGQQDASVSVLPESPTEAALPTDVAAGAPEPAVPQTIGEAYPFTQIANDVAQADGVDTSFTDLALEQPVPADPTLAQATPPTLSTGINNGSPYLNVDGSVKWNPDDLTSIKFDYGAGIKLENGEFVESAKVAATFTEQLKVGGETYYFTAQGQVAAVDRGNGIQMTVTGLAAVGVTGRDGSAQLSTNGNTITATGQVGPVQGRVTHNPSTGETTGGIGIALLGDGGTPAAPAAPAVPEVPAVPAPLAPAVPAPVTDLNWTPAIPDVQPMTTPASGLQMPSTQPADTLPAQLVEPELIQYLTPSPVEPKTETVRPNVEEVVPTAPVEIEVPTDTEETPVEPSGIPPAIQVPNDQIALAAVAPETLATEISGAGSTAIDPTAVENDLLGGQALDDSMLGSGTELLNDEAAGPDLGQTLVASSGNVSDLGPVGTESVGGDEPMLITGDYGCNNQWYQNGKPIGSKPKGWLTQCEAQERLLDMRVWEKQLAQCKDLAEKLAGGGVVLSAATTLVKVAAVKAALSFINPGLAIGTTASLYAVSFACGQAQNWISTNIVKFEGVMKQGGECGLRIGPDDNYFFQNPVANYCTNQVV